MIKEIEKFLRHIGCLREANYLLKLKKKIEEIHEKSYNDIDYFNRDMRYDIDVLYDEFIKGNKND